MPPVPEAPLFAFLGTYVPRQCGIATFTRDVAASVGRALGTPGAARSRPAPVGIVAVDRPGEGLRYPAEVLHRLDQDDRGAYRDAARIVSGWGVRAVSLQHEYGIFGGIDGRFVLDFLEQCRPPVVTTLHTVRSRPSPGQASVLAEVCARSARIVAMTDRARRTLVEQYGIDAGRIRVIPHGAPDVPFDSGEAARARLGLAGRRIVLTFGLIGPSKRIENVLDALRGLVDDVPDVQYVVLGSTHPDLRRREGERYRMALHEQVGRLGLAGHVQFVDRYVDQAELTAWIRAADVFVTPYANAEQAVSGTLTYALTAGKAIVSTPYEHARELLADDRGILVPFEDARALRDALRRLLTDRALFEATRERARQHGRSMLWSAVGPRYRAVLEEAHAGRRQPVVGVERQPVLAWAASRAATRSAGSDRNAIASRWVVSGSSLRVPATGVGPAAHAAPIRALGRDGDARTGAGAGPIDRLVLPPVRREHLAAMTGRYGIYQHATWSRPDPRHGYCTDDVARSLILDVLTLASLPDAAVGAAAQRALLFLEDAFDAGSGRFRNFRADDGSWLEAVGSEDSHGRAIQALGEVLAHAPDPRLRGRAARLLDAALPAAAGLRALRPLAYTIVGCAAALARGSVEAPPTTAIVLAAAGHRLAAAHGAGVRRWPDWPWPEEVLTYDNAVLPRALIVAGRAAMRTGWVDLGVTGLAWLVRQLTAGSGALSLVGNAGWWPRGGRRARFDQQPIDATSLLEAADAAYAATGDGLWLTVMARAFAWFRGANDLGLAMASEDRGACCDGLTPRGRNLNEGAESTLAWLIAVERMRARRLSFLRAAASGRGASVAREPARSRPQGPARPLAAALPARAGSD